MSRGEFALIARYFAPLSVPSPDVLLGVGDDAALLRPPPGEVLALSVDTLVEGVHFAAGADPEALGHKALAVNLSDLAAMGARPVAALLAVTLPVVDESWLAAFARGWAELARRHALPLVGGDTTRGPLSLSVTVMGAVPADAALRRSGARSGDWVAVTGTLGDAALALQLGDAAPVELRERLDRPTPRVEAGLALRGLATAAVDLSDGLLADLGHVSRASGVGIDLEAACLPLSPAFQRHAPADAWRLSVAGGDDYELCVALPPENWAAARRELSEQGVSLTRIGRVRAGEGVFLHDAHGRELRPETVGYRHF